MIDSMTLLMIGNKLIGLQLKGFHFCTVLCDVGWFLSRWKNTTGKWQCEKGRERKCKSSRACFKDLWSEPSGPVAEEKFLETSSKGCWKLLQLLRLKRHRIQELFCSCVWQLGCQVALISWSTAVPLYTRTHFAELGRMTCWADPNCYLFCIQRGSNSGP